MFWEKYVQSFQTGIGGLSKQLGGIIVSLCSIEKEMANMKLSARNILKGKVTKIVKGAVNAEVTIQLPGGEQVVSIITNSSVVSLGLKKGKEAYAVIKASSVMVAVD
jgi:molybdopterin-binding protein